MKPAPCKNCKDRYEACWDKCEYYISWKKDCNELKEVIKEKQQITSYQIDALMRRKIAWKKANKENLR